MQKKLIEDVTNFIFMNDAPQKSDMIFIPGNTNYDIVYKAAMLYHAGYAPYILASGHNSKYLLLKNNVPESAILCEEQATNLIENAMYSAKLIQSSSLKIERAIICCPTYQARRAYKSYTYFLKGTELLVASVETQNITAKNWWKSEYATKLVMGEVEKCRKQYRDYEAERLSQE